MVKVEFVVLKNHFFMSGILSVKKQLDIYLTQKHATIPSKIEDF